MGCIKSHELQFLNTVSASEAAKLFSVDPLLYIVLKCFTVIIQVTEGRKYFPSEPHGAPGPHVGQP